MRGEMSNFYAKCEVCGRKLSLNFEPGLSSSEQWLAVGEFYAELCPNCLDSVETLKAKIKQLEMQVSELSIPMF